MGQVLNREIVAIEIVRAFVGSMGVVASVPLTTGLAVLVGPAADGDCEDRRVARRLSYRVTESPLGFIYHMASADVVVDANAGCRFRWITDLLPDSVASSVDELMTMGIGVIKSTMESAAAGHP